MNDDKNHQNVLKSWFDLIGLSKIVPGGIPQSVARDAV